MKAAVIGLFVCPPVGHVYSLLVLLHLANSSAPLSKTGEPTQVLAFLVDLAALFVVLASCMGLLWW